MSEALLRLLYLVRFVAFMATAYMAFHIAVAPLIKSPESKVAAFFTILTSPLTRPVRSFLPPGTPETRVRIVTLLLFAAVWVGTALLMGALVPPSVPR